MNFFAKVDIFSFFEMDSDQINVTRRKKKNFFLSIKVTTKKSDEMEKRRRFFQF